jgi:hypothetical protein
MNFGQIKKAVRQKYGAELHSTTIGRYVLRAREAFAREFSRADLNAKRAEQVRLCQSIIRAESSRPADKLRAAERIACLFGLDVPARHEHSGPDGKPIAITHHDKTIDFAELETLRRRVFSHDSSN